MYDAIDDPYTYENSTVPCAPLLAFYQPRVMTKDA
jgi:hypothetical protein